MCRCMYRVSDRTKLFVCAACRVRSVVAANAGSPGSFEGNWSSDLRWPVGTSRVTVYRK